MKRITTLVLTSLLMLSASAQKDPLKNRLDDYFKNYRPIGQQIRSNAHLKSIEQNDSLRTIDVIADNHFGEQTFTPQSVDNIYKEVNAMLPDSTRNYKLTIKSGGWELSQLIPNRLKQKDDLTRTWGDIDYQGQPWVSNASLPYKITSGLQNRHLTIWASHGIYYHIKDDVWKWQRPPLFGTREDLFTQTIVTPYLIPMLERAGAIVFSPRERDWQKHEMIVDNDTRRTAMGIYIESHGSEKWEQTDSVGFGYHTGVYMDGENPFRAGTARQARTVDHMRHQSEISYQPIIPEAGRYAVYVSYQTVKESVDDAHYTVWHQGIPTEFRVNQQMGGSTWVYLGTFDFDKGDNAQNRVVLSNLSDKKGVVTADAVRFGGGMGNIRRGYTTSGLPRCLEGARYYAQWAGMPYHVYSSKNGEDDYGDDINARSLMSNHLAGGSCYMPDTIGCNVPIELSLAVHSDAGYTPDGKSHTGTLAVCTTYLNDSILSSGRSRLASRDLADELLSTVPQEMQRKYGSWQKRELWDRNYSESRVPEVPSTILETMSHQNFADMRYGQDPNFRFDFARSIYKAILRYVCRMHNKPYIVTPLTPNHLRVELTAHGEAKLSWNPVTDTEEPSATPTGYVVYTAVEKGGFDNGLYVNGKNSVTLKINPEQLYNFRVTAVNSGGESFPSEVVSAYYVPEAQKTVLIVNGFHRLSSPAVRDNVAEQGFDLKYDAGVSYGLTAGWSGYQTCFDKATMGKTTPNGLGYTDDSLAGQFIAGNDFNYIRTHAEAIASARRYSIASCSSEALEKNEIRPTEYNLVDLILGLEKNDGWSLRKYQAFSPMMRQHLQLFTSRGGALLVSGSYVGADMWMPSERMYLEKVLKCAYEGVNRDSLERETVTGLGTTFEFHRHLNDVHYAATHPDILQPVAPAFSAMKYADDFSACVAYDGKDYKAMTLGFPFECIKSEQKRHTLMRGILTFLLQSL